jgi:hypothetical protein
LHLALKISDESIKASYPSLYLNIAKCHEELNDFDKAKMNCRLALSFTNFLYDDSYGKLIKSGIAKGIERMESQSSFTHKI